MELDSDCNFDSKIAGSVAIFNKKAEQYQAQYMDFDFYLDTLKLFFERVDQPNANILDIACGPGNLTRHLLTKRPDYQVYGTDLAPNMIKLARKNNPTAEFDIVDSRDIGMLDRKFDAVICGFCTPYLSKAAVETLLIDLRSLLTAGGILYISTMEDEESRSGWQTSASGDSVYTYYHQLTHLQGALNHSGFEIFDVQRKPFPVPDNVAPTTDLFIYAKAI